MMTNTDIEMRLCSAASTWRDVRHTEMLKEAAIAIRTLRAHRESLMAIIARQALELEQLRARGNDYA